MGVPANFRGSHAPSCGDISLDVPALTQALREELHPWFAAGKVG